MISDPTDLQRGNEYRCKARVLTYSHVGTRGVNTKTYVFRDSKVKWVELSRNQLRDVTAVNPQLLPQIDFSRFEAFNNQ